MWLKISTNQTNCNQASSLQLLTEEVQSNTMKLQEQIYQHRMLTEQMARQKVQLSDQVHKNRVLATETESVKCRVHNLFGHKGVDITSQLKPVFEAIQGFVT